MTGDLQSLSTLQADTDWASVKKVCNNIVRRLCLQTDTYQYHKLNGEPAIKEAGKDITRERLVVDNIVTSMVAMKSVMQ